jgi:hypothetical protein
VKKKLLRKEAAEKVVDETTILGRPRRGAKLSEEVWMTVDGRIAKYNLAYANHLVCQKDNGRVLGFDNSHGVHHRHFMGTVEPYKYQSYGLVTAEFHEQVVELWRQEDEENA